MVEGARLEIVWAFTRLGGSNPLASARPEQARNAKRFKQTERNKNREIALLFLFLEGCVETKSLACLSIGGFKQRGCCNYPLASAKCYAFDWASPIFCPVFTDFGKNVKTGRNIGFVTPVIVPF